MKSRIEQLKQFTLEDPQDAFNWYALALEYKKTDVGKAIEIFSRLLTDHREYIPTYYHLGRLYQDEGRNEEAHQVFTQGVEEARKQGDHKALHELLAAIQDLDSEGDSSPE
jgi:tetratricopeptide (TPR) repeat protein